MRAPPRSRLPTFVSLACLGLLGAWLGLQGIATSGHEPTRALLAGVDPIRADLVAKAREDYVYADSSWVRALEVEARYAELDVARLTAFADDLADEIAWWLLAETGELDPHAAERVLWARGHQRRLPLRIAEALVARGIAFRPESLLSRSFDAELNRDDATIHLDCDQLVHLLLHLGWRLDLDLRAVPAPLHLYAVYRAPGLGRGEPGGERELTIETTHFAEAAEDPDEFLVDRHWHRAGRGGNAVAQGDLAEAAGLFEPLDDRGLDDEITANLVLGLVTHGLPVDRFAELEARLDGTRNTLVVSNLHVWLLTDAKDALARGSADLAARRAARAVTLRRTHGHLNAWARPDENLLMADALRLLREDPAARASLDRSVARGEAKDVCDVLEPLGDEREAMLPSCG